MTRWTLLATGIAAYGAALVIAAPASLLDARLADASAGRLHLTQARGTLWSGRGRIELRDDAGRTGLALPCAWRLHPLELLRSRLVYAVALGTDAPPATLTIAWSRIDVAGLAIALPAAALGPLHPSIATLGPTGEVELRIDRMAFARDATEGGATLRWRSAGSVLAPVSPLGDYEFRLDGQGRAVRATLRTVDGPLDLVGHGQWPRAGAPEFIATARLPPRLRGALVPFLRLVAVEQRDGSFEWTLAPPRSATTSAAMSP